MKWALEQLGHDVTHFLSSTIPMKSTYSFFAGGKELAKTVINSENGKIDMSDYDVIWYRRVPRAIPDPTCHPADVETALRDWASAFRSLQIYGSENAAFSVNEPKSSWNICKITQLDAASRMGFNIPLTLVSNDPEQIASFVERNADEQCIIKPLSQASWISSDHREFALPTTIISLSDLENADTRTCPAIYQKLVKKEYEVRCTVIGKNIYSVKIDSQSDIHSSIDFRNVKDWSSLKYDLIHTPINIENNIFILMKYLNIYFGAFDFIVTPEGEWVFLEVNTMGNFLWIELYNDKIPLLQNFAKFLESRCKNYSNKNFDNRISLKKFIDKVDISKIISSELDANPNTNASHYVLES